MKQLTRQQLQQNAERLLKAHNKERLFATQDGNYFFAHHDAINHNGLLKQENKNGWDGEVIIFDAPAEKDEPVKHIITQEDLDNNPEMVDQGVKVGDEIIIPTEAESKAAELKIAKDEVKKAEKELTAANTNLGKATKALTKTPADEALKAAVTEAQKTVDACQVNVDNAKTKLQSLTK